MLKQIIMASSNEGDIVLDCFCGSGTTLDAAFQLNRKWIGVDNSIEAIKAVILRFLDGLSYHGDYVKNARNEVKQLANDEFSSKCSFQISCMKNYIEKSSEIIEIIKKYSNV